MRHKIQSTVRLTCFRLYLRTRTRKTVCMFNRSFLPMDSTNFNVLFRCFWSALLNNRRKALLSSVGFRKRMTSRSPRVHFSSIVHSELTDDLTGCFEVLSCFFDHPSIDSTKKMLLHPFGNDLLMFPLDQAS